MWWENVTLKTTKTELNCSIFQKHFVKIVTPSQLKKIRNIHRKTLVLELSLCYMLHSYMLKLYKKLNFHWSSF